MKPWRKPEYPEKNPDEEFQKMPLFDHGFISSTLCLPHLNLLVCVKGRGKRWLLFNLFLFIFFFFPFSSLSIGVLGSCFLFSLCFVFVGFFKNMHITPEVLSSSLMKRSLLMATTLRRPVQSGASSVHSDALVDMTKSKHPDRHDKQTDRHDKQLDRHDKQQTA